MLKGPINIFTQLFEPKNEIICSFLTCFRHFLVSDLGSVLGHYFDHFFDSYLEVVLMVLHIRHQIRLYIQVKISAFQNLSKWCQIYGQFWRSFLDVFMTTFLIKNPLKRVSYFIPHRSLPVHNCQKWSFGSFGTLLVYLWCLAEVAFGQVLRGSVRYHVD